MKKGWIVGCAAAVLLGAVITAKVMTPKQFAEGTSEPLVEAVTPGNATIELTSGLVGSVEPEEVVYVYPKASGDVTEVFVKAGEQVTAGQVLCVIDTKQVESAKSQLDSAQLALRQAKEELQRQTVLYQSGGVSEQAYQQYKDNVESAQISYENARISYENQVSYSRLTTPITGIIEVFNAEVFDTVSPNDLICVISGQSAKVVAFSTTERIKKNLHENDMIVVEKDGERYEGIIYEVSSMADANTGLFKVKARLGESEDESALATGSMVKLYVISDRADNVMTIPINSVYYDGGLAYVYTYDNGILHKVQVETGLSNAELIEIKSGLTGTEQVVTTWSSELTEGATVRLKDMNAPETDIIADMTAE